MVAANITDYKLDSNLIILANHKTAKKTGVPRRIGVGQIMTRILIKEVGDRETGPIFRDETGRRWTVGRLSTIYSQLRNRLGFSKELVLYCARHEHGTYVCQTHGIHAAQHSLGHRSIQTTQRYVHPDDGLLGHYQDTMA